jgi:hypothetical protein
MINTLPGKSSSLISSKGSIFGEMTMVDPQEKDESAEVIEEAYLTKKAILTSSPRWYRAFCQLRRL